MNYLKGHLPDAGTAQIDQRPSRKSFHLNEIISLSTGFLLAREGVVAVHRLVAFVMETEATAENTAHLGRAAKECIEEQLPFLKDLALDGLYAIFRQNPRAENPYIRVWCEMQELRYGDEHYLVPRSRWQSRKESHKLPAPRQQAALTGSV
jgi:hypothetical protein